MLYRIMVIVILYLNILMNLKFMIRVEIHYFPKKSEIKNINFNLTNPFNESRFGNVIIIGDSHAGDLKEELEIHLNKKNLNLHILSYLNIFSLDFFNVRKNGKMKSLKKELNQILEYRNVSTIILMSRFPLYWHRKGFDNLNDDGKEVHAYINYFKDENFKNLPLTKRKKMISESFNNSVLNFKSRYKCNNSLSSS